VFSNADYCLVIRDPDISPIGGVCNGVILLDILVLLSYGLKVSLLVFLFNVVLSLAKLIVY
jgi:hypothetical protein